MRGIHYLPSAEDYHLINLQVLISLLSPKSFILIVKRRFHTLFFVCNEFFRTSNGPNCLIWAKFVLKKTNHLHRAFWSRCSHAMLLSLDTGSFRSNNHRLVPREHARLQERHNFLRFSRGNLLNIFYIFYLREETTPRNSEPENGEKSSFICNRHRDNLYSRGIFPRKNYFTGYC